MNEQTNKMNQQLNEYKDYPKWIDSLTKEEQYQWYLNIKKSLPTFEKIGDAESLKKAIAEYEVRNNIV